MMSGPPFPICSLNEPDDQTDPPANPVLKASARLVEPGEFSATWLATLADDMLATLQDAGGVGLAAPQVGESVRVILAGSFPNERSPDRPHVPISVFVNPRIVAGSPEAEEGWEGCLSFSSQCRRAGVPASRWW